MPVRVDDVVRCAVKFLWDGSEEFINVYHVKHLGTTTLANSTFLAGIVTEMDLIYTELLSQLSSLLQTTTIECYNVTLDAPVGETSWGVAVVFTDAAEPLPTQTAAILSLATGVKRSIGKKFIPGMTIDSVNAGNVVDSTFQTALEAIGAILLTQFQIGVEDFAHGVYREAVATFVEFVSAVARDGVFTQRRRRPGAGN